jgi:hypothetical protein
MSLTIVEQPEAVFFKDEGGKKNYLKAVVKFKSNNKKRTFTKNIPMRATLYYESGMPVEANDQDILKVKDSEKKVGIMLDPKAADGEKVFFRIEKVSRRKDNQKFMLQLAVDKNYPGSEECKGIEPAMTHPINVLSKRKIPAHLRSDPEAIAELKRKRKRPRSQSMHADGFGNNSFNNRIAKKLDHMAKSVEELRTVVNSQANTMRDLLELNYYLKSQLDAIVGPQSSVDLSQVNGIRNGGGSDSVLDPKRSTSAMSTGSMIGGLYRATTPQIVTSNADLAISPGPAQQSALDWVNQVGGTVNNNSKGSKLSSSTLSHLNTKPSGVKRLKSEDQLWNFGVPGGTRSPFSL